MSARFAKTPDVARTDGGVHDLPQLPGLRRVPRRRSVDEVALRALRHRVHGEPPADLLHRARVLLGPHPDRDDRRPRRPQRVRRRRRRSPHRQLPLLDLLRGQQEGAQHPRGRRVPRADQRRARQGRPPLRRPRGRRRRAPARARHPVGGAREHPRARAPSPRRPQGRDPPGLPLLQGLPRRDHGQQRELHGPRGAPDSGRRGPDRRLQREDHALRRRLPPALREPVDLGRGDA